MIAKLSDFPNASVLVHATVLGTSVWLTTSCAHPQHHVAPTCGPCCHGDQSSCYQDIAPPEQLPDEDGTADQASGDPPADAEPEPEPELEPEPPAADDADTAAQPDQ